MKHMRMSPEATNDCGASDDGDGWTLDYQQATCPDCLRTMIATSRRVGLTFQAEAMEQRLAQIQNPPPARPLPPIMGAMDRELLSLVAYIETHAPEWHLVAADCGEGETVRASAGLGAMLSEASATDEAKIYYRRADKIPTVCLLLVFGNGPGELVADGTQPPGSEDLWATLNDWSDQQAQRAEARAD